jgi:hypothetical protein
LEGLKNERDSYDETKEDYEQLSKDAGFVQVEYVKMLEELQDTI